MNPEIWTLTAEELPLLNVEEHAFIEKMAGRTLTNTEAQILLRAASLEAAFNTWVDGRKAN